MKIKVALLSVLFLILLLVCAQASATTTTVMMYMCGTDLQSDCVNDIYEMCSVDLPGNVNVVVQAGGAAEWDDSDLQPNAINRFAIGYLSFEDIQSPRRGNMGSKDALVDFISGRASCKVRKSGAGASGRVPVGRAANRSACEIARKARRKVSL